MSYNYRKTFTQFMKTYAGVDQEFRDRFERAGVNVDTLGRLKGFAKSRWPGQYDGDWRKDTSYHPFGKEQMGRVWSDYLAWCEQDAPNGVTPQEATPPSQDANATPPSGTRKKV